MRTSDLIDLLAKDDHPVRTERWCLAGASVLAFLAALALTAAFLGIRPFAILQTTNVMSKLVFTLSIACLAAPALLRALRPGAAIGWQALLPLVAAVLIVAGAIVQMDASPGDVWRPDTPNCLILIPMLALPGLLAILRAARHQAPTDLARAGLFAGLVAGSLSATAYALHCPNDDSVYLAAWYLPAIMITGLLGRTLGTRLLAW